MYYTFPVIVALVFGTFIGSFLNVLILRHNTGKTLLGRSGCMSCRGQLRWFELVPVVSWLTQRGRCRRCHSQISRQYPLVELLAGLLFVFALFFSDSALELVLNAVLFSILLVILVYDLRHKIIPDRYVWAFVGLGALSLFIDPTSLDLVIPSISSLLAGPVLALPFAALWFFSKGTWIGFGDAKLALGIGVWLGLSAGLVAILYSFWIGALVSVGVMAAQKLRTLSRGGKQLTMKSEVPFAPFLILGFLLVYLLPQIFLAPFSYLYF